MMDYVHNFNDWRVSSAIDARDELNDISQADQNTYYRVLSKYAYWQL